MAAQKKRKAPSSSGKSTRSNQRKKQIIEEEFSAELKDEIVLLFAIAITILLFLCNFHIIGKVGNAISAVMFGIFGSLAYVFPPLLFFGILFIVVNLGSKTAMIKSVGGFVLFFDLELFLGFITKSGSIGNTAKDFYTYSAENRFSAGVIGGCLAKGLGNIVGIVGAVVVALIILIVCLVILTEKSFVKGVYGTGRYVYDNAKNDASRRIQKNEERRLMRFEQRELERKQNAIEEKEEAPAKPRADKKVSGIADVTLKETQKEKKSASASESGLREMQSREEEVNPMEELDRIRIHGLQKKEAANTEEPYKTKHKVEVMEKDEFDIDKVSSVIENSANQFVETPKPEIAKPVQRSVPQPAVNKVAEAAPMANANQGMQQVTAKPANTAPAANTANAQMQGDELVIAQPVKKPRPYKKPPIHLLTKNEHTSSGDSERQLKETALQLKEILKTFGVNVTITDISQGPSVTRYELQPEMGVKVSKIVNLTDDIKLNLAATDIRIEAPIPGKAAIGIEVPNKENSMVLLRDLIETKTFREFDSNLSFAVGKDIAGQTVVTDIGKMPHVLIAGSTGSGKSVCINTLIMSILYKSSFEDVKLIMIDPKVVELSVYNGIPHLLLPVVTDPKKASAALKWGVKEMEERYKKFEDMHVRDLKGYNKKVSEMTENDGQPLPEKLPQIVIIVDELADLMMVAPGEVEESICRLAQLARAAGIHLVLATQRPSVDVITGLIKANMPSRIAFAVSSGVDSRTILDMVGAEKLLGKGDMLFYPQGYPKPARMQGAFVSDKEVADVVDFIIANNDSTAQSSEIVNQQMMEMTQSSETSGVSGAQAVDDKDVYFADAGRFVIEKDKASIGMLQRVFKIGFNRAARIMDQLCEYGVVGEEEGTKPRRILMTIEQFENLLEEI